MKPMYYVYCDYGYQSQFLLTNSVDRAFCVARMLEFVADRGLARYGFAMIELARFADDGEYVTEARVDAEETAGA